MDTGTKNLGMTGRDAEGWHAIAPVDPADERVMWFSLDPSDGASDRDHDIGYGDPALRRRKTMKKTRDEITADRVMRDGHLYNHAGAMARRRNQRGEE